MHLRSISALLLTTAFLGLTTVVRCAADPVADPAAVACLKEAHDNRASFPDDFAGLTATLEINDNGKERKGTVTYKVGARPDVKLTDASKEQLQWALEQLGSAISHRLKDNFEQSEGKNAITFIPDDHSPLGRQLSLNDRFKSLYRVKDKKLTEVTRTMGDLRFTITVLDNLIAEDGKYVPSQFVVTYFDAATGAIKKVDEYSDAFVLMGRAWIPSTRRVVTAENGGFTTRSFALTNVQLITKSTAANIHNLRVYPSVANQQAHARIFSRATR